MAQFVWDPAVQWPPPAHILLNYDTTPPETPVIDAQTGVLRAGDIVPDTHGGTRVVLVPQPIDPAVADLQERVTMLEAAVVVIDERLVDIEARVAVPPTVLVQSITFQAASVAAGTVLTIMQASANPTSWAILDEEMNNLPTTGYWLIDSAGRVSATTAGAAGIKRSADVDITVEATNALGSGSGHLTIHFT